MLILCQLWPIGDSFFSYFLGGEGCDLKKKETILFLLTFSMIDASDSVFPSWGLEWSIFTGCFKNILWALYYVCAFWITVLASPAGTGASYLGLSSNLTTVLLCALLGSYIGFPHPLFLISLIIFNFVFCRMWWFSVKHKFCFSRNACSLEKAINL